MFKFANIWYDIVMKLMHAYVENYISIIKLFNYWYLEGKVCYCKHIKCGQHLTLNTSNIQRPFIKGKKHFVDENSALLFFYDLILYANQLTSMTCKLYSVSYNY